MTKIFTIICFFGLIISSCNNKKDLSKADFYYAQGNDFLEKSASLDDSIGREKMLIEALKNFESGLKINNQSSELWENKIKTLGKLGRYKDATTNATEMEEAIGSSPENYTLQGILLERQGKKDQALEKYNAAIIAYSNRAKQSSDPIPDKCNIAFLYFLTKSKDSAFKYLDEIISTNPENEKPKILKESLEHFNREEFIGSYFE